MTFTNLKIVRIVGGCNLYGTGSEFFIYIVICHNRDLSSHQWKNYILSYDIFVSFILRMYRNSRISQESFRSCSCNLKEIIRSYHRILNVPEESILFLVFNFRVRQRSLTNRTPVNDSGPFINKSFFMKVDKYLRNCLRASLIHGKTFSVPIAGYT